MLKRIICILAVLLMLTGCKAGAGASESTRDSNPGIRSATAVIHVKDYGTIEVRLDGEAAPVTVENFVRLAQSGFYDGLTFHRIISGFMIQGGDPKGNGTGGSDKNIRGEFLQNGIQNPIAHKRGTISMARSSDPDSASSQFFIMHADAPYLDGAYAGFGCVTSGMEVVDAICENTAVTDGNGTVLPENQPVIASIVIENIETNSR